MDWKEYKVNPTEGSYEKIEKRVARRRAWRVAGVAGVTVAAVGLIVMVATGRGEKNEEVLMAEQPAVATTMAETATVAATEEVKNVVAMGEQTMGDAVAATVKTEELPSEAEEVIFGIIVSDDVEAEQPSAVVAEATVPVTSVAEVEMAEPETRVAEAATSEVASVEEPIATTPKPKVGSETRDTIVNKFNILKTPNIIAPSSDEDEVRAFYVTPLSKVSDFGITIYNRRGMKVYHSDDVHFRWNGELNGQPVQQGAYIWVATFRDEQGTPRQEKGSVVVVR